MEESYVESNVNVSEQVSDAPAVDEVAAAELLHESSESTGAQKSTTDAARDSGAKDDRQRRSREFSERLNKSVARERANFENEPAYVLGKAMISQRMAQDGVDAMEAVRRINDDRAKQQAAEYAKNPESFYLDMMNGSFPQNANNNKPNNYQSAPESGFSVQRISEELIEAKENGYMPEGFTPSHVTNDFISDVQSYGTRAALELWSRSHISTAAVADELQRRKTTPQPMRTEGQASGAPKVDIKNMSSSDFKKFAERMKQEKQRGRRITF